MEVGDIIISFGDNEAGPRRVRPQRGWLWKCGQREVEMGGGAALLRSGSLGNCSLGRGSWPVTQKCLKTQDTPKRERAFHQAPTAWLPISNKTGNTKALAWRKGKSALVEEKVGRT